MVSDICFSSKSVTASKKPLDYYEKEISAPQVFDQSLFLFFQSLVDGFVSLCSRASYSRNKNRRFVWHLKTESRSGRWAKVVELVLSAAERVVGEQATSEKDRKLWSKLKKRAEDVKRVMQRGVTSLFSFVNGALSNAVSHISTLNVYFLKLTT